MSTRNPAAPQPSAADRLEQRFVFRLARMIPLGLALVAGVLAAAAVVAAALTLIPVRRAADPAAPTAPPAVVVTAEEVQASLQPKVASQPAASPSVAEKAAPPADAVGLAAQLHAIRGMLASGGTPWRNEYRRVCTSTYLGYCLNWEQQLAARGGSGALMDVLELYDTGGETHSVVVTDSSASSGEYVVNYSNAATKRVVLDEGAAIIARASPEERAAVLRAWSDMRSAREKARRERMAAEESKHAEQVAATAAEYERKAAERKAWRTSALSVAALLLGSIVTLAILLGILAIERNTRALKETVKVAEKPPVRSPAVTPFSSLQGAHTTST